MKKVFLSLFVLAIGLTSNAQKSATKEAQITPQAPVMAQPKMSKEQKDAMKAKKEAELAEAFKKAELTDEQQKNARSVLDAFNEKSKAIKADAAMSADDRKAKLDEINKEKNEKLKEVMGEAKNKIFKQVQKAQKEASSAVAAPTAPVKE